jgi:lipopolysaccharide export system protein LptA
MPTNWLKGLSALALCTMATSLYALPDDRLKAIEIQASSAIREEKKGLTQYSGNVVIRQGSILIKADTVNVHSASNKVDKIICLGKPAYYQQTPQPGKDPVIARGNRIEYLLSANMLHLIENASLEQEGATLNGEHIEYDTKAEIIRARGGSDSDNQRIRMVIPPSQQQGNP